MKIGFIQDFIDICRGKKNVKILNEIFWNIRRLKKNVLRQKINLVFVCHRPQGWESLKTVFETCNNDEKFNVTIVATPYKKQLPELGFNHEIYETEGAEDFFKDYPCRVINGYSYETKEWFDLKSLKPDYVFIQRPYNICYPKEYSSEEVAKYARILYVPYFMNFIDGEVFECCYNTSFFKDVYCIFTENKMTLEQLKVFFSKIMHRPKIFITGFPRYDELEKFKNIDSDNWNLPRQDGIKRVIWTPRWSTNENNCHFFDYKDFLIEYAENNKDIDFIFRPHPQAFLEWNATGELPEEQAEKYKKRYENCPNAKVDEQKEYFTTFYSSDFMITDVSSVVAEYFLTGKPIIYCHKTDCFNDFSRKLSEGFYWVHNQEELEKTIEMLKSGEDSLYEKRQQLIKECFYINPQGAGYTIKELIKKDFYV